MSFHPISCSIFNVSFLLQIAFILATNLSIFPHDAPFTEKIQHFQFQFHHYRFCNYHQGIVAIGQPVLLAEFLDYFTPGSTTSTTEAWLHATGIVLCSVVRVLTHHPYFFGTARIGMRVRVGLCSLMYRKVSICQPCRHDLHDVRGYMGKEGRYLRNWRGTQLNFIIKGQKKAIHCLPSPLPPPKKKKIDS